MSSGAFDLDAFDAETDQMEEQIAERRRFSQETRDKLAELSIGRLSASPGNLGLNLRGRPIQASLDSRRRGQAKESLDQKPGTVDFIESTFWNESDRRSHFLLAGCIALRVLGRAKAIE
jgi:hypothetical protein